MTGNEQWDQFISSHRWGVLTTLRGSDPVSSVVAYACDGDDLVISTPGFTFKKASVEKNPNVNICIISNSEPFNFVAIEGHATVETEALEANTRKVFANIEDTGYQLPEDLPAWLADQQRVIIRVKTKRAHGVIR